MIDLAQHAHRNLCAFESPVEDLKSLIQIQECLSFEDVEGNELINVDTFEIYDASLSKFQDYIRSFISALIVDYLIYNTVRDVKAVFHSRLIELDKKCFWSKFTRKFK